MLNVAVKAARAAGAIINRAALDVEAVRISQKQVNDFVTEVDQNSERAIIDTLLTAYPDHGILAEESGSTHGNPNADHIWIIDPLDGTTNFIHGFPYYCVSIALQVQGRLEQAVIYDPTRNDLFTATKGRGAFALVNGQHIGFGFVAQQRAVGERAGRDHAHHFALHGAFAGGDVAHLFANGDRFTEFDEAGQIRFDRVKRHTGHDHRFAIGLAALRECDVEQAHRFFGIGKEQLVKVAHAIKKQRVWVLGLEAQVLLHHGGVPR